MEIFDVESKARKKEYRSSTSRTPEFSKFNCLLILVLILFSGFFILILINYMVGHREIVVEVESLQTSIHDTLSDEVCEEDETLCLTKECVITSARIMSFMDESKNPCEDFYEYACASYPKLKSVRFGEDVYNPHVEASDNIDIKIKRLMDASDSTTNSGSLRKMKALYDTCTNTTKRNENSTHPLIHFLEVHGISWPIMDEVEPNASWTHFVAEMTKYGIHTIFTPTLLNVREEFAVALQCSMPMLPAHVYLNPEEEESSTKLSFYKDVILLFLDHMDIRRTVGKNIVEDIMKVETELAQTFKMESSKEFQELSLEHKQQLKEIFAAVSNKSTEKVDVLTDCPGNFEEMMRILNTTSKKTVLNYLGWRAISHLMKYMGSQYQSLYNHYAGRIMKADTVPVTNWRECSRHLRHYMGVAIAKALVDKNYIKQEQFDELKKRFLEMKHAFVHVFHMVPWLDNETESGLIEKLNKMTLQIGYPSSVNEPEVLDRIYKELEIDSAGTFFDNIMKLRRFLYNHIFTDTEQSDNHLRNLRPLGTAAKYIYPENMVEVELGNLISPLMRYGADMPKYLEYGQNMVLAHQMSHAFDTVGLTYNSEGKPINANDLPELLRRKFFAFVACLAQQYQTPLDIQGLPDNSIINKDIADLGSFFITAAALNISMETEHEDENGKLPGLPFTKQQIYFLQASQLFCEVRETDFLRDHETPIRTQKQRVNGAISNMVNFEDVFKCSVETKMNPTVKCNLLS